MTDLETMARTTARLTGNLPALRLVDTLLAQRDRLKAEHQEMRVYLEATKEVLEEAGGFHESTAVLRELLTRIPEAQ